MKSKSRRCLELASFEQRLRGPVHKIEDRATALMRESDEFLLKLEMLLMAQGLLAGLCRTWPHATVDRLETLADRIRVVMRTRDPGSTQQEVEEGAGSLVHSQNLPLSRFEAMMTKLEAALGIPNTSTGPSEAVWRDDPAANDQTTPERTVYLESLPKAVIDGFDHFRECLRKVFRDAPQTRIVRNDENELVLLADGLNTRLRDVCAGFLLAEGAAPGDVARGLQFALGRKLWTKELFQKIPCDLPEEGDEDDGEHKLLVQNAYRMERRFEFVG